MQFLREGQTLNKVEKIKLEPPRPLGKVTWWHEVLPRQGVQGCEPREMAVSMKNGSVGRGRRSGRVLRESRGPPSIWFHLR